MLTKPLWPVMDYVGNYNYIVTILCENRDQPELECNGKCHLSKEIAKEASDEDKNPLSKSSKTEIPPVIISEDIVEFAFVLRLETPTAEKTTYRSSLNSSLFITKILHPPQVA